METLTALKQYARAVRKRWWLPVLLAVLAVGGAFHQFGGPRWVASTLLMPTTAPAGPPSPGTPGEPQALQPQSASVVNDIVQLVGTQSLAERVARRVHVSVIDLQKSIAASVPRNTDMVSIQVTGRTPQGAADSANVVAEELVSYFQEINAHNAREARQFIEQQLAKAKAELAASDDALLLARQGPLSQEGAPLAATTRYYAISAALDDAQRALRERDARLEATTLRLAHEQPTQVSEVDTQESGAHQKIQSSLTDLEIQRTQLRRVFTPQYPLMQVLEAQIPALKTRLLAEPKMQVAREVRGTNPVYAHFLLDLATLQVDRAGAASQVSNLRSTMRDHQVSFASLAAAQSRVARIARESQILAANYSALAVRYQDAVLREHSAQFFPAGLQVVQRAVPPLSPWRWFVWIAIAACVVGLALGIAGAIGLEALDESVRTSEEVERTLGAAVLAEVPNAGRLRRRLAWATVRPVIGLILVLGMVTFMAYWGPSFTAIRAMGQAVMHSAMLPHSSRSDGTEAPARAPEPAKGVQKAAEGSATPPPQQSLSRPTVVPPEAPSTQTITSRHDLLPGVSLATASQVISTRPKPFGFHVQAGAFNTLKYAQELIQQLHTRGYHAALAETSKNPPPHRVWVGEALDRSSAARVVARLQAEGFEAILIPMGAVNEESAVRAVSPR